MTLLVRAASLHGYEALAKSIGVDPIAELSRVGLSAKSLSDPEGLIPYFAQFHLLEHTATAGHCPDFGLRLAKEQGLHILGPLAILLRHAATMGDALELASKYVYVHSPAIRIAAVPVAGRSTEVDLTFNIETPNLPPYAQTLELGIGVIVEVITQISQGKIRPILAMLPHARIGPKSSYAKVLGFDCHFEAPQAALRFAAEDMVRPLPEYNAMLQELASSYLNQHFGSPSELFSDQVRALVRRFLGSGQSTQADIARMLAIHPRTMQRRLLAEGHHFEGIVEGVRKDQLVRLLASSQELSLLQIALMLGYSEMATLTRSCRRWFNSTPSQLRERLDGHR